MAEAFFRTHEQKYEVGSWVGVLQIMRRIGEHRVVTPSDMLPKGIGRFVQKCCVSLYNSPSEKPPFITDELSELGVFINKDRVYEFNAALKLNSDPAYAARVREQTTFPLIEPVIQEVSDFYYPFALETFKQGLSIKPLLRDARPRMALLIEEYAPIK